MEYVAFLNLGDKLKDFTAESHQNINTKAKKVLK